MVTTQNGDKEVRNWTCNGGTTVQSGIVNNECAGMQIQMTPAKGINF